MHPPRPRSAGYSRPGTSRAAGGLHRHRRLLFFLVLLNPREAPCPKQMVEGILKQKNVHTKPLRFCPQMAQCSSGLPGPDAGSGCSLLPSGPQGSHGLFRWELPSPSKATAGTLRPLCLPPMKPEPPISPAHSQSSDYTHGQAAEGLQVLPDRVGLLVVFSISPT